MRRTGGRWCRRTPARSRCNRTRRWRRPSRSRPHRRRRADRRRLRPRCRGDRSARLVTAEPDDADAPAVEVEGLRVEVAATGHDIVAEVNLRDRRRRGACPRRRVGVRQDHRSTRPAGARTARGADHRRPGRHRRARHARTRQRGRRSARGRAVSYVPQDPSAALNPARRIGAHLTEALEVHDYGGSDQARRERVAEMMREVSCPTTRLPAPLPARAVRRPAAARHDRDGLRCRPAVVVLDEPTTGLTSPPRHTCCDRPAHTRLESAAALYVSHDLSVIAQFRRPGRGDVRGRLIEQGRRATSSPRPRTLHPHVARGGAPTGCAAHVDRDFWACSGARNPPARLPVRGRCTLHDRGMR